MAEPQSAALGLLATPTICSHIYPATWTIRVYGQLYPSCTASTIPLDMTFGVGNGVRTRDLLNGNQILYQLSYTHIWYLRSQHGSSVLVPHPTSPPPGHMGINGVGTFYLYWHMEPTTESGAEYWIRTSDPLLVRQML